MVTVIKMPPRGHYLAWEAGQLAGVSGRTIGQWARRGYIRSSQRADIPRIYSFQDVAEAMVVHELLDRGVVHRDIRKALDLLQEYGDWPLTEASLSTEPTQGRTRLLVNRDDAAYDVADRGWQQVVSRENLAEIRTQLQRGGWAVRRLPDLEHIEVDPDRLSGRPSIRGRRIAAQDVVELAAGPDGMETLLEDYELDRAEVVDARRWWREVSRLQAAA